MQASRLLLKVALLLIVLHGNGFIACSQDISWMKGLWKQDTGRLYRMPPVVCFNELEITTVADSTFTGLQTTLFALDTNIKVSYACSGLLSQSNNQFRRGNLIYKKNSNEKDYEWKNCEACNARTCSLYVEHDAIKILLINNDCDSACNGTIVYYKNLNAFDTFVQQRLSLLYGKPQNSSLQTSYNIVNTTIRRETDQTLEENVFVRKDSSLFETAMPPVLKERTNKLAQTLKITTPYIEVILLDDAEIDGDIVSLYHNNEEVISHKTLGREVIKYSFKADKQHTYHELVLVAENLGSIPPNTALMRIRAGDKKYELTTRANLHENAKVIIEYTDE